MNVKNIQILLGKHFHFNQRLLERYGIEISFEEYIDACRLPSITYKINSPNKKIVLLKIKDKLVVCGKERHRDKALVTALHISKTHIAFYNKKATTKQGL